MRDLLYLTHRLPFPPNKGDKVRSYHLLKHLCQHHRVFLGTFMDDPEDERYVNDVRELCEDAFIAPLNPRTARIRSLSGLFSGEALTLTYYGNTRLGAWVRNVVKQHGIQTAVVFSSAMAQYVASLPHLRVLLDFVDVDSAKWAEYATLRPWPLSWIYRRESERLLSYERVVAARSARSFFVSELEAALFRRLAPECGDKLEEVSNGVDAAYFSPEHDHSSPYPTGELAIVFTGVMDYWPNIDAVRWFASNVLPTVRARWPRSRFYIVGMRPAPSVEALAGDGIVVTGKVPDIRPYLRHASVVVAPLRVARGVQNKILEAMAMARPVVASRSCVDAIRARLGEELTGATEPNEFVECIDAILRDPQRAACMGKAARRFVLTRYSWAAHLAHFDAHLSAEPGSPVVPVDASPRAAIATP